MTPESSSLFDRAALLLSGLCLLHCLGGALVFAGAALAGGWLSHQVHLIGLGLAMPLAGFALLRGFWQHERRVVLAGGGLGLGLMAASLLVAHHSASELWLSVTGVSVLAGAHFMNMRLTRG